MYRCLLGLLLLWGGSPAWAQAPTQQWQRDYGLPSALYYNAFGAFHTSHNRVAVVGTSTFPQAQLNGPATLYLLTSRGDTLRTAYFSGTGAFRIFYTGAEATNGDLLLFGMSDIYRYGSDHLLVRTDSLGRLRWQRTFGNGRAHDTNRCLPLPDNGALLVYALNDPAGTIYAPVPRANVMRIDSLGNVVWQRQYGRYYDQLYDLALLADGSYALAGSYTTYFPTPPAHFETDTWLLRLDVDGNVLRDQVLAARPDNHYAAALGAAPDGGLLLAGSVSSPGDRFADGQLQFLDSTGRLAWQQRVRPARPDDPVYGVLLGAYPTPTAGQVVVAGSRANARAAPPTPSQLSQDGYLAQYNARPGGGATPAWELSFLGAPYVASYAAGPGTLTTVAGGGLNWPFPANRFNTTRLVGLPPRYEVPACAQPPAAYFAAAVAGATLQVLNASAPGPRHARFVRQHWNWGDGTASDGPSPGSHAYAAPPGPGTAVTLTVTNNLGCTRAYTAYPFGLPTASQSARARQAGGHLYPNPAAETATLAPPALAPQPPVPLALRDALGRLVRTAWLPVPAAGPAPLALDLRGLPPGVYTLHLAPREGPMTLRLVKE